MMTVRSGRSTSADYVSKPRLQGHVADHVSKGHMGDHVSKPRQQGYVADHVSKDVWQTTSART
jgi:hypothetical protein